MLAHKFERSELRIRFGFMAVLKNVVENGRIASCAF
jgi:hypothetical protein